MIDGAFVGPLEASYSTLGQCLSRVFVKGILPLNVTQCVILHTMWVLYSTQSHTRKHRKPGPGSVQHHGRYSLLPRALMSPDTIYSQMRSIQLLQKNRYLKTRLGLSGHTVEAASFLGLPNKDTRQRKQQRNVGKPFDLPQTSVDPL